MTTDDVTLCLSRSDALGIFELLTEFAAEWNDIALTLMCGPTERQKTWNDYWVGVFDEKSDEYLGMLRDRLRDALLLSASEPKPAPLASLWEGLTEAELQDYRGSLEDMARKRRTALGGFA